MAGYGGFPAHNQDGDGYYGSGNQAQFRQYPFPPVQYGMHPPRPFSPQKSALCAFPAAPQFLQNCDLGYQFESHLPNFSSAGDAPDYFPPPPPAPPSNIPHDAGAAFSISGAPVRYPAQHASFRGRGFMMRGNRGRGGALGRSFDNKVGLNTNESADKQDVRRPPKSQQFYCDLCKISCAGPLAFRDHQAGQRHKKRLAQSEAAEKLNSAGDADAATPPMAKKRKANRLSVGAVHELRCPLCDVGCTGVEAYTAHINGKQHQKTLRLHRDLGKPIPSTDIPQLAAAATEQSNGGDAKSGQEGTCQKGKDTAEGSTDGGSDPKPLFASPLAAVGKPAVGEEYIEVDVAASAKSMHYRCKLCDCQFSADAKILHVKGRRHRLQYKNKVDPSLEVEQNKGSNIRRLMSIQPQRDLQTDITGDQAGARIWDFIPAFNSALAAGSVHPTAAVGLLGNCMPVFPTGGAGPVRPAMPLGGLPPMPQAGPPQPPTLVVESRCVMSKHSSLLPTEAECQAMKAVIGMCEHGLKRISDTLVQQMTNEEAEDGRQEQVSEGEQAAGDAEAAPGAAGAAAKDRRRGKRPLVPNEALRLLRGVVRVGALGQGLLLRGEHSGDLILVCSEWPTAELIRYLTTQLPDQMPAPERPMDFDFQSSSELGLITIVASPKPVEKRSDDDGVAEEPKEGETEKEGKEDERGERRKSGSSGWRGRQTDAEKWPVVTVRIQLTSPVVHDEERDKMSTSLDRAGDQRPESSTDRAGEEAQCRMPRPTTGLSNQFALGGPTGGTPIARKRCLEAFEAIYQAKWFQSKFNRPGLTIVARVVRDFVISNPSWRGLNEFATLALLDRLLSVDCYSPSPAPGATAARAPPYSGFPSNHRGTAPARLLRRFFESIGSGLLLQIPQSPRQETKAAVGGSAPTPTPASGDQGGAGGKLLVEPPVPEGEVSSSMSTTLSSCYPIDLFSQLSVATREQITREAQFMLRQIAFRQMYKVLRMVPYSRPTYSQKDSSLSARRTSFSSSVVGVDDEEARDCCDVDVVEDDGNDEEEEDLNGCSPEEGRTARGDGTGVTPGAKRTPLVARMG